MTRLNWPHATLAITGLAIVLGGCESATRTDSGATRTVPAGAAAREAATTITALDAGETALIEAFNADADSVRLVMILSPI